jgi:hypothetical protein
VHRAGQRQPVLHRIRPVRPDRRNICPHLGLMRDLGSSDS